ncbi:hypothetical protein SAMN06298216_0115 [Spirosomataceae bacterium TFI 002]|nr:hypothetical protein SAMN06298216_0115 [Spirosomataceae bacterium TFI 002]
MIDFIFEPWPWYVAGPIIGLTVPLLLILGNKTFGISNSLRHTCAALFPSNIPFFNYNWKKEQWIFFFAFGIMAGAFIAVNFLSNGNDVAISEATKIDLRALGINNFDGLLPVEIFSISELLSLKGFFFVVFGGFLVGFGTRYAGGCTSGHAIMGLSNLQWPSLVATICFMVGGIFMTHAILPFIFKLI